MLILLFCIVLFSTDWTKRFCPLIITLYLLLLLMEDNIQCVLSYFYYFQAIKQSYYYSLKMLINYVIYYESISNVLWILIFFYLIAFFNPIQDEWGAGASKKTLHTSFSTVTCTSVEIRPQNFLTFNFNIFATLV